MISDMRCFWGIFLFLFIMQCVACSGCAKQAPRIRSADRKIIDSLYKMEVEVLQVEMDSLCNLSFEERLAYTVDSIMTVRLVERKNRLGY
jgi:hypothetical protein